MVKGDPIGSATDIWGAGVLTYICECPQAPPSASTPTSPPTHACALVMHTYTHACTHTNIQVSLSPSAVPLEIPTLLSPWTCELTLSLHLLTELSPLQAQWTLPIL